MRRRSWSRRLVAALEDWVPVLLFGLFLVAGLAAGALG